jgi:general stress protein CsbA
VGDTHRDPTDHFRTTHQHAGESMIDVYCWPGLFLMAVGVIALIGSVAAAAYGHQEWLLTTGVVALVAIVVGGLWIAVEHRRVRRIEMRWLADHPGRHIDSMPRRF